MKPAGLRPVYRNGEIEAGVDEAGRGCLAGPVFAAAVIWPEHLEQPLLDDSKKLSEKNRYLLREYIQAHAVAWSVQYVSNEEIDRVNIVNATYSAMHMAINGLGKKPSLLLIDGHGFTPHQAIPHVCIVKGDGQYLSIAAASILAKTYRDDFMIQLHKTHPEYRWNTNKGYATAYHREALFRLGLSPFHRKSFRLIDSQLKFPF
jgi:ribonuclease HII